MGTPQHGPSVDQGERQRSIDKAVDLALMIAFYAYLDSDKNRAQEAIDTVNKGMDACGYPRVPNVL